MSEPSVEVPKPKYTHTFGNAGVFSVAAYGIVNYLKHHRWARAAAAILGLLGLLTYPVSLLTSQSNFKLSLQASYVPAFLGLVLIWCAALAGPEFELHFPAAEESREREEAERAFEKSRNPEDAVDLDLKRLNEYYAINQSQARSSFMWAVLAMIVGFATIISGIWLFYLRTASRDAIMAGLSTAAGIVANLLGAIFLHLYNKTQDRALRYFDRLSQVQRLALAIRLAESHSDENARQTARDRIIAALLSTAEGTDRGTLPNV